VRALLDLMREKQAAVHAVATGCAAVLTLARFHLQILHPEAGDRELIKAVADKLAAFARMAAPT